MEDISWLKEDFSDKSQTTDIEKGRIANEKKDSLAIKRKLKTSIDPLNPDA